MNRVRDNQVQKQAGHQVFLCYGRKDRVFAGKLHMRLKASRIPVWIDDKLELGQHWREVILQALAESQVVVICVGPSGLGLFQKKEVTLALQQEKKGILRVIPAILPRVKEFEIPPQLLDFHYADFRRSDIDPFQHLVTGIRRSLKKKASSCLRSR